MATMDTVDATPCPGVFTRNTTDLGGSQIDIPEDKIRYKMNHGKRGIAVIINNQNFDDDETLKQNSKKDEECMNEALRALDFKVITRVGSSVAKIREMFKDIRDTDHTEKDCFVAVFLTHGNNKNVILDSKKEEVTLTELIEYLLPGQCDSLSGKPKLFFVQVCDIGTEVHDAVGNMPQKPKKIPTWSDVLIYHSSVPGFYTWGSEFKGSWFLQYLSDALKNHGQKKELTELLTQVNCKMAFEYKSKMGNASDLFDKTPTFTSTLTKQLYFPHISS